MSSGPRIRLAILGTRGIPARYGGFETFAEQLATRLVERDVEVTVYCEAGKRDPPSIHRGVRLEYLPTTSVGPFTTVLFDVRCLWHARRGHDVVYMLGYGAAPFCFIPRLWKRRVWLNPDGVEWARAKWSFFARLYFLLMEALSVHIPNRVIADSHSIREHLLARHAVSRPISVVAYGAPIVSEPPDSAILDEWALTSHGYHLIVCRLEPENHVWEMIEGFVASKSQRSLIVVGDDRTETAYVARLTRIRDPRVRFIGTIYEEKTLQALRCHAFAYLHGHSVGGTNPSLLEALGCGNAVIAHDNPHNREVARDAALYFRTPADFSTLLARLEGEPRLVEKMRLAAREIIARHYSWNAIAAQYLELLRSDTATRR